VSRRGTLDCTQDWLESTEVNCSEVEQQEVRYKTQDWTFVCEVSDFYSPQAKSDCTLDSSGCRREK
jgi:hypothetical protein